MKPIRMAAVVAALTVALGAAQAQDTGRHERGWSHMMGPMAGCPMGAGTQGMMEPHMMGPGTMGGHMTGARPHMTDGAADVDAQLDRMHAALNIRASQEQTWRAYVDAARSDAQAMSVMHERMVEFMGGPTHTAPDWLSAHRNMMRARLDSLDALQSAVTRLYNVLDAGQKATFDRYGGGMCGAW